MHKNRHIIIWLRVLIVMTLIMVVIGGITRLTDSGLSMVEWKPIMGSIPPMNQQQWELAFSKYKSYPEFKIQNFSMTLSEFKSIFFWEYFHRLFGRLIGIVFFFPFLYFLFKKQIPAGFKLKIFFGFILGGSQGLLGWYMVKSGLVDKPDVSHFRLAAHLILAFIIVAYLYHLSLNLQMIKRKAMAFTHKAIKIFFVLLMLQILFGAFTAGLDAGIGYNTFPKMGRSWIPNAIFTFPSIGENLFNNGIMIQFVHRVLGILLLGFALFFIKQSFNKSLLFNQKIILRLLSGLVAYQFALGVITLLLKVPLWSASLHQLGATFLILATVKANHLCTEYKS